jgi:hypothetical protein
MKKRAASKIGNIDDFQNKGYKDSAFAIAEIIDNSIQAKATKVDIIIVNNTERGNEIDEILIIDNGHGMNEEVFSDALVENAGSRSGSKRGLGKYGQGLPNASASQTKRVEVYTFQKGKILYNYKDLEEMFANADGFLPDIETRDSIDIDVLNKIKYRTSTSGTIVRWCNPNKLYPKKSRTLSEHIEKEAGRIYRYFLNGFRDESNSLVKCEIELFIYDFNSQNYSLNKLLSKTIKAFDPMFLMKETQMNEKFPENKHPTSEPLDIPGGSLKKEFTIEITKDSGTIAEEITTVELIFSYVKAKERFLHGRNAGDRPFGKMYLNRNLLHKHGYHNISIVRENREIDSGHFGFIGDVSKQTNRWWSVEIKVEPIVDRIMGIDSKKQFASGIRFIDSTEESEDHEILKWISTKVKSSVKTLEGIISNQGHPVPQPGVEEPDVQPLGPTEPGPDGPDEPELPTDKDKKDLFDWVKNRFKELSNKEIKEKVDWAFSIRDKYIFVNSDLGDTMLYSYTDYTKVVLIEINHNHNFYKKFMESIEDDITKIRSIRLLICSLVEAELNNQTDDQQIKRFLRKYKNRAFETLDDYIEDLYNN